MNDPEAWNFPDYPDNWEEISRRVKKRDKWTCQSCGRLSNKVNHFEAHHIKSLRQDGTSKLNNLITLCDWCHGQIHPHRKKGIVSPPPSNRAKALRRIKYLKQHPGTTAKGFKQHFKPIEKKKAGVSNIFPTLMVISLVLLAVNFVLWLSVEILLAIAWGISRRQDFGPKGKIKPKLKKEVKIGSKVTLKNEDDNTTHTYTVKEKIDLEHNGITPESPMGEALMGHYKGEKVKVETPSAGEKRFKILKIDN